MPNQCFQVSMVHIFLSFKLQLILAASFGGGESIFLRWDGGRLWWRVLSEPDRAICPSASSKLVVVRPLICSNLPLQPRCRERSYFRSSTRVSSARSRKPSTHNRTRKKKRWMEDCSPVHSLVVSGLSTLESSYGQFFKQYGFYFCWVFVCPKQTAMFEMTVSNKQLCDDQ